ncbi:MAG: hypothetical protein AAF213_03970, partial [Pseudomonadota bacterium]
PFSASPSFRLNINQPGRFTLAQWQNDGSLGFNLYNVYLVAKAERVNGPLGFVIETKLADGHTNVSDYSIGTSAQTTFDWSTYAYQIGPYRDADNITGFNFVLDTIGTARVWIGALEIVNLGLPATHPALLHADDVGNIAE